MTKTTKPAAAKKPAATKKPAAKKAAPAAPPVATVQAAPLAAGTDRLGPVWASVAQRLATVRRTSEAVSCVLSEPAVRGAASDGGVGVVLTWKKPGKSSGEPTRVLLLGPGVLACFSDIGRKCGLMSPDVPCCHLIAAASAAALAGTATPADLVAWLAQKPTQTPEAHDRCKALFARKDLPALSLTEAEVVAAMDAALPHFVLPDPHVAPDARAALSFFMGYWEVRRWAEADRFSGAFRDFDVAEYHGKKYLGEAQWKPEGLAALIDLDTPHAVSLKASGAFFCLNRQGQPCHGMEGKPCVHLINSLLKLSRTGDVPWAWLHTALATPAQDASPEVKSQLTGWLLGQLAGKPVDWRPTEAIPEDFYAG